MPWERFLPLVLCSVQTSNTRDWWQFSLFFDVSSLYPCTRWFLSPLWHSSPLHWPVSRSSSLPSSAPVVLSAPFSCWTTFWTFIWSAEVKSSMTTLVTVGHVVKIWLDQDLFRLAFLQRVRSKSVLAEVGSYVVCAASVSAWSEPEQVSGSVLQPFCSWRRCRQTACSLSLGDGRSHSLRGGVTASSRKMKSYWRESSGGLQGWWGDWNISPTRRGWGSWACSAWRREGCEGT